jgi:hypothetical protein
MHGNIYLWHSFAFRLRISFLKKFIATGSYKFQQGQWPRWNRFRVVNDPAEIVSVWSVAGLMTCWNRLAGLMTLLKSFQRSQWPRWNFACNFGIIVKFRHFIRKILLVSVDSMTLLKFEYCRFSRWIRGHMQNGYRPWIRALGGVDSWKKIGVENFVTLSL